MRRKPTSQRGFTLVEMMIALLLFSFAMAGVLSVAVTMASGFHEQRQAIAIETSVRGPMDYLSDAVRLASPSVPSGLIQDSVAPCNIGAIVVTDSVTGPDKLDVTYATGTSIASITGVGGWTAGNSFEILNDSVPSQASQIFIGDTLLVSNFAQGTLVHVTGIGVAGAVATITFTLAGCVTFPAGGYPVGSLVIRVLRAQFSVGLVDLIPTLMMDPDGPDGPLGPEPLAEGIEDMQIALGVDLSGNDEIEDPAEWLYSKLTPGPNPVGVQTPIRAVRITLVSRTSDVLVAGTTAGVGVVSALPAAEDRPAGPLDAYRRRVLTSTVEVRNLVGSP